MPTSNNTIKYVLPLLVVAFLAFGVPAGRANASTVSSQLDASSTVGTEGGFNTGMAGDDIYSAPASTASAFYTPMTSFYTVPSTVPDKLQIFRVSGNSCLNMISGHYSSNGIRFLKSNGDPYVNAIEFDADLGGGVCQYNINPTFLHTGDIISYIGVFQQNSSGGSGVVLGSSSSGGYVYNHNVSASQAGSVAYQLCVTSCSLSFTGTSSAVINTPSDTSTLSDFSDWTVSFSGLTSGTAKQLGVKYSTDLSKLTACETFPYGVTAGYSDCITSTPRIYTDYGLVVSMGSGSSLHISKSTPLVTGTTYYAQFSIQNDDAFGSNIIVSPIISFTIGVPSSTDSPPLVACTTFDVFCHLKNWANWLFIPSNDSWNTLFAFNLSTKSPFSYFYDIPNVWTELFPSSGTGIDISIPLFGTTVCLICTSRIIAIPGYSVVEGLLSAMAYFGTAWALYELVRHMHKKV